MTYRKCVQNMKFLYVTMLTNIQMVNLLKFPCIVAMILYSTTFWPRCKGPCYNVRRSLNSVPSKIKIKFTCVFLNKRITKHNLLL